MSWVFIGRTDVEAETAVFWPPDAKSWLIWKDPDVGKDWRQEEKGTTEDEMVRWHHRLNGVWVNSRSWRWTGRPGVLWLMGSQRVGHDWVTELTDWLIKALKMKFTLSTYFQVCTTVVLGFPDNSAGKESTCNAGDPSLILGSGRSAGEGIGYPLQYSWVSVVAQLVKNPPAMWETGVQSLSWEDALENEKATHSSILAWRTS